MKQYSIVLASLLLVFSTTASSANTVVVDASKPKWHSGGSLKGNSAYVILPDPTSRWKISTASAFSYQGTNERVLSSTTPIGGNWKVRIGSLTVLVWHKQPNGAAALPEVFSFDKGQQYALIRTGAHGGSIHFLCADLTNTYGDNSGVCKVQVEKDNGHGGNIRVILPITARRGSSSWSISQKGSVECSIKYTVGSGSGSKKYASGLVIEFLDGSTYTASATKTIGRHLFKTKKGTAHIPKSSIPKSKLGLVRHAYVIHDATSLSTVREHIDNILDILRDAGKKYRELKNNELVKDAVKVYFGGEASGRMSDV